MICFCYSQFYFIKSQVLFCIRDNFFLYLRNFDYPSSCSRASFLISKSVGRFDDLGLYRKRTEVFFIFLNFNLTRTLRELSDYRKNSCYDIFYFQELAEKLICRTDSMIFHVMKYLTSDVILSNLNGMDKTAHINFKVLYLNNQNAKIIFENFNYIQKVFVQKLIFSGAFLYLLKYLLMRFF